VRGASVRGERWHDARNSNAPAASELAESTFLVRVAGLPVEVLDCVASPITAKAIHALLDEEQALLVTRDRVSAVVGGLVPTLSVPERRVALRVRRQLYARKRPEAHDVPLLLERLSGDDRCLIEATLGSINRFRCYLESIPNLLAGELADSRRRLGGWLRDENFLASIVAASPALYEDVQRALRPDGGGPINSLSQVEDGLLRYVVRAAMKTSPFGRFTSVARGDWVPNGSTLELASDELALRRYAHVHVYVGWLQTLERMLAARSPNREKMPACATRGRWVEDGRLWFLRRKPSGRTKGAALNSESVVSLQSNEVIESLLAKLTMAGSQPLSYGDLIALATELMNDSPEQGRGLIEKLVEIGLVEVGYPIPTTERDPWAYIGKMVRSFATEEALSIQDMLERLRRISNDFNTIDCHARAMAHAETAKCLRESFALLGLDPEKAAERNVSTWLLEDTAIQGRFRADPHAWKPLLGDMRLAASVYLVIEPIVANQYDMAAEFSAKYGGAQTCDHVLRFFRDFYIPRVKRQAAASESMTQVGQKGWSAHPNEFSSPEIARINQLRGTLGELIREGAAGGGATLRLSPEGVRSLGGRHPYPYSDSVRATVFSMLCAPSEGTGEHEPGAVLNQFGLGFAKFASRFCWLLDDLPRVDGDSSLIEQFRQANREAMPADTVLAEMGGLFGTFDVELHPPLTDYTIGYPGEAVLRPSNEIIELDDLRVVHNAETRLLELESRRLGKKIWPVHLGFLAPTHSPPLFRCLLEFGPPFSIAPSRLSAWHAEVRNDITYFHSPRIQVGKLVLSREQWALPVAAIPFDLSPNAFWLELQRLRRKIDLPGVVFRQSDLFTRYVAERDRAMVERVRRGKDEARQDAPNEGGSATIPADILYRDDTRKPMYLDFDSFHLVNAFRKSRRSQGEKVVFTEVLPKAENAALQWGDKSYVTEVTFAVAGIER